MGKIPHFYPVNTRYTKVGVYKEFSKDGNKTEQQTRLPESGRTELPVIGFLESCFQGLTFTYANIWGKFAFASPWEQEEEGFSRIIGVIED